MTALELVNLSLLKLGVTKQLLSISEANAPAFAAALTYDHDLRALLRRWPWPFATKYLDLELVRGVFWNTDPTILTDVQAWDATFAYRVGDVVRVSSINYYCILANTNNTPPNATFWSTSQDDAPLYANPDWSYGYRYPADCLYARRITEVAEGTQRKFDDTPISFRIGRDENHKIVYTNEQDANLEYTMIDCEDMWSDDLFLDAFTWRLAAKMAPAISRSHISAFDAWQMAEQTLLVARSVAMNEQQVEKDGEASWIRGR